MRRRILQTVLLGSVLVLAGGMIVLRLLGSGPAVRTAADAHPAASPATAKSPTERLYEELVDCQGLLALASSASFDRAASEKREHLIVEWLAKNASRRYGALSAADQTELAKKLVLGLDDLLAEKSFGSQVKPEPKRT